ncbi:MAG TPA: hypothetical protein VHA82_14665 [Ramlibacter sp.]|uniref:hypothetical protein n=1 Tax=Ramlibacter sp. TaxID=1917967 RepID=UPI002CAC6688|nr:hypothetical protein [Ramlibacter sp.]HVZ45050.1 hypothetical protein [Ramlibacter sp.]
MNPLPLTDLHAGLLEDTTGERREALLAKLRGMLDACLAAKRQLCDRDTYRRLQATGVAVGAAIRIVETLPQARDEAAASFIARRR